MGSTCGTAKPKPVVITKPANPNETAGEKKLRELAEKWAKERELRAKAIWPDTENANDIRKVVYDQIRLRRQPRTENCRNFLVQIVLIRKIPKNEKEDPLRYVDVDPSGEMAWYVTFKYNTYTHHLDKWDELRASRLVPQKMNDVISECTWQLLLDEPAAKADDVSWRYGAGEPDENVDYSNYEALVCPGRHIRWPKVSLVFGAEPQFPMYLMKGSIIKKLDLSKPFAIPKHEEAMKMGALIGLSKCHRIKGEEADMEEPDLVRGGMNERVNSTSPYIIPIFELTENRGYLSPTARIVFISHRWLTPDDVNPEKGHPDDIENSKLRVLQKILKDDDFVFLDLWSIPQAKDRGEDRGKAIYSLNTYVDWCSEFIALCPSAENRKEYGERGWTNLELVSALAPVVKEIIVHKWNTDVIWGNTADNINFVDGQGVYEPLQSFALRDPKEWKFGFPQDAQAVVPIARAIKERFQTVDTELGKSGEAYVGNSQFKGNVNVKQVLKVLESVN